MGKTGPHRRKHKDEPDPAAASAGRVGQSADPFLNQVETGLLAALSHAAGLDREFTSHLGHRCLLAFSGGPDSTSLLLALAVLRNRLGFELSACHVNHHLRGAESESDEQFCHDLAERIGVSFLVRHVRQEGQPSTSEAALREARYAMLADAAHCLGAGFILLAHTLDDQAETLLFRLLRGTGPAGLVGMEPSRRLDGETVLLRPMLAISRRDCMAYLERSDQNAVEDSSNASLEYTRNYIRHRLIPPIRDRFPGFESRMDQLRQIIAEDETLMETLTDQAMQSVQAGQGLGSDRWSSDRFATLPAGLKRRVLAAALNERDIEVSFERVSALLEICGKGGALSLNQHWDVRMEGDFIYWVQKGEEEECNELQADSRVEVRIPGLTIAPNFGKALRVEPWSDEARSGKALDFPDQSAYAALVDFSKVTLPLEIRKRRAGDLIRPFGMNECVRLKKFLHNKKFDAGKRKQMIVIADQDEVIWVPGVGLSNKVKVEENPTHRLSWLDLTPDETELC